MKHNPTLWEWRGALTGALVVTGFFVLCVYIGAAVNRSFPEFVVSLFLAMAGGIWASEIFHGKPKR